MNYHQKAESRKQKEESPKKGIDSRSQFSLFLLFFALFMFFYPPFFVMDREGRGGKGETEYMWEKGEGPLVNE